MTQLCELCTGSGRTSCEGKEGWDEQEAAFGRAWKRTLSLMADGPDTPETRAVFEDTKHKLIARRAANAQDYLQKAHLRGCTQLIILPFVES